MPGTPQVEAAERRDTVAQFRAHYDSALPMTGGQIKELMATALSLIPADIPKGFAQELLDKELPKIIKLGIAQKRRDWRILHSGFQAHLDAIIPPVPAGNIIEFGRKGDRSFSLTTPNVFAYVYSRWGASYEARPAKTAYCFEANRRIEHDRFIEALGGTERFKKICSDPVELDKWTFTPRQVVAFLETLVLAHKGWNRMDRTYQFLIGVTENRCPLMVELERTHPTVWKFLEWPLEPAQSIEQNSIIVLGQDPFLGL